MRWILVDVVLALGALLLLAVLLLGLWRKVKALSRTVARAGELMTTATDVLAQVQGTGPQGGTGRPTAPERSPSARR